MLDDARDGEFAGQAERAAAESPTQHTSEQDAIVARRSRNTAPRDLFTSALKWALAYSEKEAAFLGDRLIGDEHFLLGLIREETGDAGRALRRLGANLEPARKAVAGLATRTPQDAAEGEIRLSPWAQQVIETAVYEARARGHRRLGTPHLLLALVHPGAPGAAVHALQAMGISTGHIGSLAADALDGEGGRELTRPTAIAGLLRVFRRKAP